MPYSRRNIFNAIPDTNHNANPTNPNRNSKGKPNSTNPNTRYRCEYGTLNSMFASIFEIVQIADLVLSIFCRSDRITVLQPVNVSVTQCMFDIKDAYLQSCFNALTDLSSKLRWPVLVILSTSRTSSSRTSPSDRRVALPWLLVANIFRLLKSQSIESQEKDKY